MSLINAMLRELDKRGAVPAYSVPAGAARANAMPADAAPAIAVPAGALLRPMLRNPLSRRRAALGALFVAIGALGALGYAAWPRPPAAGMHPISAGTPAQVGTPGANSIASAPPGASSPAGDPGALIGMLRKIEQPALQAHYASLRDQAAPAATPGPAKSSATASLEASAPEALAARADKLALAPAQPLGRQTEQPAARDAPAAKSAPAPKAAPVPTPAEPSAAPAEPSATRTAAPPAPGVLSVERTSAGGSRELSIAADYRNALEAMNQGRAEQALEGLAAVLRAEPKHPAARRSLALLLVQRGRMSEAQAALREGLALLPDQPDWAMLLARIQIEAADPGGALETLEKTLPHARNRADYHALMGTVLQMLSRHGEALAHYEIAVRMEPRAGRWLAGLGISLDEEKRFTEARDAYRRALDTRALDAQLQAFVERKLKQLQ